MYKVAFLFYLIFLTVWIISCEKSDESAKIKTIEITQSSFKGGYPAVWFNSINGEIKAVGINPDELFGHTSDYKYWVEPSDPEFGYLDRDNMNDNGIKLIGTGEELFNSSTSNKQINDLQGEILINDYKVSNVFYIRYTKGDCVIIITEFNQSNSILKFKWRLLE